MKKLFLILFVIVLNLTSYAQYEEDFEHQVITIDNQIYSGKINSYLSKQVNFIKKIKELGDNSIPVENIAVIRGNISKSRMRAILKDNPTIIFRESLISAELIEKQEGTNWIDLNFSELPSEIHNNNSNKLAGDFLISSGRLHLTSYGFAIGTSLLAVTGVFNELETSEQMAISVISGAVILGTLIAGEIMLIKAGNKMNQDAITLSPSGQGIGFAINF